MMIKVLVAAAKQIGAKIGLKDMWPLYAGAAAFIIVLFPYLFRNWFFIEGDAIGYYYPVFKFYGEALKGGESFLWNPYIFSGFPTYLSQSAGFLDPLNIILFKIFEFGQAYHARLLIDLVLAFVFSYVFGRMLGLSKSASFAIGFGYLTSFGMRLSSNPIVSHTLFVFPMLLVAVERLRYLNRSERFRRAWIETALFGILLGWSFLHGYTQIIIYSISIAGVLCLLYAFDHAKEKDWKGFARPLGQYIFVVILAALIGSPHILASLSHVPLSVRAGGLDYSVTTFKSVEPGDVLNFVLPDYMRIPYIYHGRKTLYIGFFLFLMFVASFFSLKKEKRTQIYLSGLFLFCFIASLRYSPIFYVLNKLPVFKLFRFPFRWMFLGAFLMSVLAAYGFDSIRKGSIRLGYKKLSKITWYVTIGISGLIAFLNLLGAKLVPYAASVLGKIFGTLLYGKFGFTKSAEHYAERFEPALMGFLRSVSLTDPLFLVALLLIIAGAWVAYAGSWKMKEQRFVIVGAVLAAVTYMSTLMIQWPKHITAEEIAAADIVARSNDHLGGVQLYRTYPFRIGTGISIDNPYGFSFEYPHDSTVRMALATIEGVAPNGNIFSSIPTIDGYDMFNTRAYLGVLTALGSAYAAEDTTQGLSASDREQRLLSNLNIIGMMAGRYIVSGQPLSNPHLAEIATQEKGARHAPIYIYENDFALPRFYFAASAAYTDSPEDSMDMVMGPDRDFRAESVIECAKCHGEGRGLPSDSLNWKVVENGRFEFETDTSNDRWLIISESLMPGWTVSIDGSAARLYPANGIYMAVLVPSGSHTVAVRYNGARGEAIYLRAFGLGR